MGITARKPGKLKPRPDFRVNSQEDSRTLSKGWNRMGSIRTWSPAAVACIFVVVVAHQRSNADVGSASPPAVVAASPPSSAPAGRVTGLPDFSDLVAQNGAAVVNISVVEKPQK